MAFIDSNGNVYGANKFLIYKDVQTYITTTGNIGEFFSFKENTEKVLGYFDTYEALQKAINVELNLKNPKNKHNVIDVYDELNPTKRIVYIQGSQFKFSRTFPHNYEWCVLENPRTIELSKRLKTLAQKTKVIKEERDEIFKELASHKFKHLLKK